MNHQLFLVCTQYSKRLEYVIQLWNTQIFSPTLIYSDKIPAHFPYLLYEKNSDLHNSGFLFTCDFHFEFSNINIHHSFPDFDFFSYAFALATECYHYDPHFPKDFYLRYNEKYNPVIFYELHKIPFFPYWAEKICKYLNIPIHFYPSEPLWFTLDIDNPFHFQYRGWKAQWKSLLKSLIIGDFKEFLFKIKIAIHKEKDPFNTENWLPLIKNLPFLVFFLMNDCPYNANTSPFNYYYHQEIQKISNGKIGLHCSLNFSKNNQNQLVNEKKFLEQVSKCEVFKSRQHYLQYELPHTFQMLIQSGIYQDYTTCFYSQPGYKHGLVRPFLWYDLTNEQITSLIRFPVFFMDRHALIQKMKITEILEYIRQETFRIQSYGGIPMILLHNETFSNRREWSGFPIEELIKICKESL